jgi:hypothetical protein
MAHDSYIIGPVAGQNLISKYERDISIRTGGVTT